MFIVFEAFPGCSRCFSFVGVFLNLPVRNNIPCVKIFYCDIFFGENYQKKKLVLADHLCRWSWEIFSSMYIIFYLQNRYFVFSAQFPRSKISARQNAPDPQLFPEIMARISFFSPAPTTALYWRLIFATLRQASSQSSSWCWALNQKPLQSLSLQHQSVSNLKIQGQNHSKSGDFWCKVFQVSSCLKWCLLYYLKILKSALWLRTRNDLSHVPCSINWLVDGRSCWPEGWTLFL